MSDFEFTSIGNGYSLGYYAGNGPSAVIPSRYNGKPVTAIGKWVFDGRKSVKTVTIPSSVTCIDEYAFRGCGLESIAIPDSVTFIGENAFEGCLDLKSVKLPKGLKCIERYMFWQCGFDEIELPESVAKISEHAFYECRKLASVSIPAAVREIGEGAFWNCESLVRAHFDDPDGWCLAQNAEDDYGESLDSEDLSYPKEAAKLLKKTFYFRNYWKKR